MPRLLIAVAVPLAYATGALAFWNRAFWNRPWNRPSRNEKIDFNTCLLDFGAIEICQSITLNAESTGLLEGIGQTLEGLENCCDGLNVFLKKKCGCHPGFNILAEGQLPLLTSVCKVLNPFEWATTPIFGTKDIQCKGTETFNYGCGNRHWFWRFKSGQNDMEIEAERLQSAVSLRGVVQAVSGQCLNVPLFVDLMKTIATDDLEAQIPYGVGLYKGIPDVAEYFGISIVGLNHGFWDADLTGNTSAPGNYLYFTNDGKRIDSGGVQSGEYLNANYNYKDTASGSIMEFRDCETKFSRFEAPGAPGLAGWIELYTETAMNSKRWGPESICKIHDVYCRDKTDANGNSLTQYESTQACLDHMHTLPRYSQTCGNQFPLGGNSLPCRFKHHFMVPTNPAVHCAHLGPAGTVDINGNQKCSDSECDGGSDPLWFPTNPDNVPQEIVDAVVASNAGWESVLDEPLGCGIATDGSEFGPADQANAACD